MAKDLLFEIGVEELPASFVAGALTALPELADKLFAEARLSHGAMRAVGTARRLSLLVTDVAAAQTDRAETVTGPPVSSAFDKDGKPTQAAIGFAKKQGFGPEALTTVETPKGKFAAVHVSEKGKAAADVLPALLGTLCAKVPFPKSMRWGPGEIAFGRPVHWMVALHGESVLPVAFAGVTAGNQTRGHRFLAPAEFSLKSPADYEAKLDAAKVVVDPAVRKARMGKLLEEAATKLGGVLVPDPFLMDENMALVEYPHVIAGKFEAEFLDLPDSVIISVMRNHQRYFAVRTKDGKLMPAYLNVVNTANAPAIIAEGNDRVLRARLKDARFFVSEDRKKTLDERVAMLDRVTYQAKIGSVGERVTRLAALAESLGSGEDAKLAGTAARLAKADLVTLIVGEFPELQGDMGRFYALEQGVAPRVADAIRDHYLPKGAGDTVAKDAVGALVGLADRADALVGCFGIGLVPSGSADPFALRRATLGIVRTALEGPLDVDVRATLTKAYDLFPAGKLKAKDEVLAQLDEFFRGRLKAYYADRLPGDVIDACLSAWAGGSVRDLDARMKAVDAFRQMPEYTALAVAFKRTFNIAKDAPAGDANPALFTDAEEKALAERFSSIRPSIESDVKKGAYEAALTTIAKELRGPIDSFFEKVFVMAEDTAVRENRLRLLGTISRTLTAIAHFQHLSA